MAPLGMKPLLRFVKMTEKAIAPTKGSPLSAGYDLYSAYDVTVPPKGKALVKTDIQVAVPSGCYGRVAPRSGLAVKNFIDVGAGVVDEDYRGNLGVVLFNFSDVEFVVKHGDRVAQLICERIEYPELEECQSLDETERGAGGFGSTGVSKENVEQKMDVDAEKVAAVVDSKIDGDDSPISPRKRQALSAKDEN